MDNIITYLQFFIGRDVEIDILQRIFPEMDRYYHDNINYRPNNIAPSKILNVKCRINNSLLNLTKYISLCTLNIVNCNLHIIPCSLPTTIRNLYCGFNELFEIPNYLPLLEILTCEYNKIGYLPECLTRLKLLDCRYNNLNKLPNCMFILETLICDGNYLETLPKDITNIKHIYCSNNKIKETPRAEIVENNYSEFNYF